MTKNQIDYWSLQERLGHNAAVRAETQRSNKAQEAERHRSAVASETETHRSNVVREAETHRHNYQSEAEARRSNIARETENYRSNLVKEAQNLQSLQETARHNAVTEAETQRANQAREAETHRANVAGENLSHERNAIQWQANAITSLANQKLAEHYVVQENLESQKINTTNWNTQEANRINNTRNLLTMSAQIETERHNRETENAAYVSSGSGLLGSLLRGLVPSILNK